MTNPPDKSTRRKFLKTAAAGFAAFHIVPRHVLGGPRFVPPSEKVNVAVIGCGGRARQILSELYKLNDCQVISLADPCEHLDLMGFFYKSIAGRLPVKAEVEKQYAGKSPNYKCTDYVDFREMLDQEKAIDAVVVASPDHQHAHQSIIAMRQGKHVMCEKPLTHNIREARLVAKVAQETGVATQMGNTGHSNIGIRETVEVVQSGLIGPIREIHAWVSAVRWNKQLIAPPTDMPEVPKGLNWDLWIGPRAMRPYHPAYHGVAWRDFWDFGLGALGDFGCHDLDSSVWALDLLAPDTVQAFSAGKTHDALAPYGGICHFRFSERGTQKPVHITWYDGGLQPELPKEWEVDRSKYRRGVLFIGEKGVMLQEGAGGKAKVLMQDRSEFTLPSPSLKRSNGHYRDWLDACKGGEPASSNFAYGARLTEITLLGVLAYRTGKQIAWDYEAMKATNVPEADAILQGDYRPGWDVV